MTKKATIFLANPRGFCAGVERAISIVEKSLEKFGAPVYVRHEIVHNPFVLDRLRAKGAIFVKELDEVPDDAPVIFSAHGVPKTVPAAAQARDMTFVDATCPLVSKVHRETERHHRNGAHVILIGHAGHPEVIGTMGQIPAENITLIETIDDIEHLHFGPNDKIAYATQTTLSLDDTKDMITALQKKYPQIESPKKEDICYATTNRQEEIKKIAQICDVFFIVGAVNSSNSNRLVEVARKYGAKQAFLIGDKSNIPWDEMPHDEIKIGISAGASAPDDLVQGVIAALKSHYDEIDMQSSGGEDENIKFNLPRILMTDDIEKTAQSR